MSARCSAPGDRFAVGPVWTRVDARVDTGSSVLPSIEETTAGLRARLFVDQTDHAFFPTQGFGWLGTAYAAMTSFGSALDYQRLEGVMRGATSWGPHTLQLRGFRRHRPGVGHAGVRVVHAGRSVAPVGLPRQPVRRPRIRVRPPDVLQAGRSRCRTSWVAASTVGGSAEVGRINDRSDGLPSPGTLWSGSVFLGADTFLGPAYLGVGFGASGHWSLYLLLGAP